MVCHVVLQNTMNEALALITLGTGDTVILLTKLTQSKSSDEDDDDGEEEEEEAGPIRGNCPMSRRAWSRGEGPWYTETLSDTGSGPAPLPQTMLLLSHLSHRPIQNCIN